MPEAVLAVGRRLLRERAAELLAAGLLLAMAANLISVVARKSITIDETIAIPSGYYYLTKDAFNLNSEHPLFPPYFLFGIVSGLARNAGDHQLFLLGTYSTKGWWYYFPVAVALKTTVPFFLLTLASLAWAAGSAIRREARLLLVVAAVVVYALAAMLTRVNIGIRHFLPVFPFVFILGGALLDRVLGARRRKSAGRRRHAPGLDDF